MLLKPVDAADEKIMPVIEFFKRCAVDDISYFRCRIAKGEQEGGHRPCGSAAYPLHFLQQSFFLPYADGTGISNAPHSGPFEYEVSDVGVLCMHGKTMHKEQ